MKSVTTIGSLKGKRVLIRVDYNVPLKRSTIVDARRIEASYQTIDAVLKKGGTPILIAHLGDGTESLAPILKTSADILEKKKILQHFQKRLQSSARYISTMRFLSHIGRMHRWWDFRNCCLRMQDFS
jgi:3-phosphoglycerate kinase